MTAPSGLSGRRGQAARNDGVILAAAREVFLADPKAPIAAVADRAGVGISALSRRYANKEDLLRRLCHDGLRRFNEIAEAAAAEPDGWLALTRFLADVVDADVHSLTVHLAGTFTPTADMSADARRSGVLVGEIVERARHSGHLRDDVDVNDIGFVLEACAAIRVPDAERTRVLRRRYLAIIVDGFATPTGGGRDDLAVAAPLYTSPLNTAPLNTAPLNAATGGTVGDPIKDDPI
ncbi:MAG: helix-turn-helix transcriptional regulator [Catenulispora sp.]|nr:helix-turn-helix transcriptional regulator [Catenulispora sp.]